MTPGEHTRLQCKANVNMFLLVSSKCFSFYFISFEHN
jgi:hypothetical protein